GRLTGPAAGLLHREEETLEGLVSRRRRDGLALVAAEDLVAVLHRRLLDLLERVGRDQPLISGPIQRSLHSCDGAAARALAPAGLSIEPAGDVEGLQVADEDRTVQVAEGLRGRAAGFVGCRLVVPVRPVEEDLEQ